MAKKVIDAEVKAQPQDKAAEKQKAKETKAAREAKVLGNLMAALKMPTAEEFEMTMGPYLALPERKALETLRAQYTAACMSVGERIRKIALMVESPDMMASMIASNFLSQLVYSGEALTRIRKSLSEDCRDLGIGDEDRPGIYTPGEEGLIPNDRWPEIAASMNLDPAGAPKALPANGNGTHKTNGNGKNGTAHHNGSGGNGAPKAN